MDWDHRGQGRRPSCLMGAGHGPGLSVRWAWRANCDGEGASACHLPLLWVPIVPRHNNHTHRALVTQQHRGYCVLGQQAPGASGRGSEGTHIASGGRGRVVEEMGK